MKKILLLIQILFIVGCSSNDDKQFYLVRNVESNLKIWCDTKTGIEYLMFRSVYKAGLTVYLDENGNPARCVVKEEGK